MIARKFRQLARDATLRRWLIARAGGPPLRFPRQRHGPNDDS